MVKLKTVIESNIDDINGINADINNLASKYLTPIDAVRSRSKPASIAATEVTRNDGSKKKYNFAGIDINTNRAIESRISAFLRTLGFPIMDETGNFFNSGFDPDNESTMQIYIKSNIILSPLQTALMLREAIVEERRLVFANQDFPSSVYALALRFIKPFMVMDLNLGPLDIDPQNFEISDRKTAFNNPIANKFSEGNHILKPFIVDPMINDTIYPAEYMIAVPFLPTMEDASLSKDKLLKRPAIEFICRIRLADTTIDSEFLKEAQHILSNKNPSTKSESATTIRDTVSALVGQNDVNDNVVLQTIQGFTTTQTVMLTTLVKTIKAVVEKLDEDIVEFNKIYSEYDLEPVPSIEGPEFLGTGKTAAYIRTFSSQENSVQKNSLLNTIIARLKLQQQLQLYKNKVTAQTIGGGNTDISSLFAVPVIASAERDYNTEIQRLENDRDSHSSKMLEILADIEKITGEISGLGLIDVLAIYTALWAIDIKTLIGFLDDSAFNRLYDFNTDLRTTDVESRNNGEKLNGILVLQKFQDKLFNILSFADKIMTQKRNSPTQADGGDGTQG